MGKVVKLEKPSQGRRTGQPRRRRPARSKTALVLGGGGFTGGVYEIGALRALDLLAVNRNVNEFDVYVGTSAGSFIASMAANGVTPEEMMRVVNQQVPTPFRDIDLGTLLRPNYLDFAKSAALLPLGCCESAARSRPAAGRVDDGHRGRSGGGPAAGRVRRFRHRALPRGGARRPRPHRRLPPAEPTSCTCPRRTWTPASASCSAPKAGTTSRSPPPCGLDRAADGLQAGAR